MTAEVDLRPRLDRNALYADLAAGLSDSELVQKWGRAVSAIIYHRRKWEEAGKPGLAEPPAVAPAVATGQPAGDPGAAGAGVEAEQPLVAGATGQPEAAAAAGGPAEPVDDQAKTVDECPGTGDGGDPQVPAGPGQEQPAAAAMVVAPDPGPGQTGPAAPEPPAPLKTHGEMHYGHREQRSKIPGLHQRVEDMTDADLKLATVDMRIPPQQREACRAELEARRQRQAAGAAGGQVSGAGGVAVPAGAEQSARADAGGTEDKVWAGPRPAGEMTDHELRQVRDWKESTPAMRQAAEAELQRRDRGGDAEDSHRRLRVGVIYEGEVTFRCYDYALVELIDPDNPRGRGPTGKVSRYEVEHGDPREVLGERQLVNAKVLAIYTDRKGRPRIDLSIRQAPPWAEDQDLGAINKAMREASAARFTEALRRGISEVGADPPAGGKPAEPPAGPVITRVIIQPPAEQLAADSEAAAAAQVEPAQGRPPEAAQQEWSAPGVCGTCLHWGVCPGLLVVADRLTEWFRNLDTPYLNHLHLELHPVAFAKCSGYRQAEATGGTAAD